MNKYVLKAPGEQIWCAHVGGSYGFTLGTSIAAAIYSGSIAFNFSKMLTDSADLLSIHRFTTGAINWAKFVQTDRGGLLDLADPKYSSSQNKICTYSNRFNKETTNMVKSRKIVAKVGETKHTTLFIYEATASYEILSPVPADAKIERNVMIFAPSSEPSDSGGVSVTEVHYTVTNITGEIINNYIQLVTVGQTFDQSTLPADDPLINVTQLKPSCTGANSTLWNCLSLSGCWTGGATICKKNSKSCYCV